LALDRAVKAGKCICKAGHWGFTGLAIRGGGISAGRRREDRSLWARLQS